MKEMQNTHNVEASNLKTIIQQKTEIISSLQVNVNDLNKKLDSMSRELNNSQNQHMIELNNIKENYRKEVGDLQSKYNGKVAEFNNASTLYWQALNEKNQLANQYSASNNHFQSHISQLQSQLHNSRAMQ